MECFYTLLGLAVAAAVLAGPVLAVVAFARARRTERQLDDVARELAHLRREVATLRRPGEPSVARDAASAPAPPPTGVDLRAPEPSAAARERQAAPPPPAPPPAPPSQPSRAEAYPGTPTPSPGPDAAELIGPRPGPARPRRDTPHPPPGPPPGPPRAEPPPGPPRPPGPEEPPRQAIDWEQWIGVKGAAVLGGVLFALAGLYFVRFAIDEGWLAPPVRIALGLLAGLGAVVGSEVLRRRGYEPTANAVAGGGVVVLYASIWAARSLYGLFPAALAFGLMALVTAAAGVIAWRHRSQVVAVLGLVGGFATPLLVETDPGRPLSLFGYLLVLNLALVVLARRRRWPLLAPLGLLATFGYEALWIATRMEPRELVLALVILAVFAALFAFAANPARRRDGLPEDGAPPDPAAEAWDWTRFGAVTAPFAFALYLALRADLGPHLWPVGLLMLILSVAAEALDRGWGRTAGAPSSLPLGAVAAGASVAVVAAWTLRTTLDTTLDDAAAGVAWEAVGIAAVLAAAFHAFAELDLRRGRERTTAGPLVTAGGFLLLLGLASLAAPDAPAAAPWLAGWTFLAALLVRQGWLPSVRWRPVAAAALLGLLYPVFHLAHGDEGLRPEPVLYFALLLASAVGLQLVALLSRRAEALKTWAEAAALALPVAALAGLFGQAALQSYRSLETGAPASGLLPGGLLLGLTVALGVLGVLAATRLSNGLAYLGVVLLLAWDHWAWSTGATGAVVSELLPVALAAVLFTLWPLLAGPRLRERPQTIWGSALAGPAWFPTLLAIWTERWGDAAVGLLPVLLGALALAAAFRARALWPAGDPARLRALAWFGAVALGFAALAVPLQLENEWITVAWALEGVAVLALWRRLDHPGLKYFGLALLAAVTARLVANPAVLGYHPRSGLPILNWLAYTYLVPAASLVASSLLLARHEVERARPAEGDLYRGGRPVGALATGAAAIAVIFVWINLAVFDLFSTGGEITLEVTRTMARDLTLSLAWAVYALVLLALGFARDARGLRGVGLGLLTLTVVKVFLYDLAGLEDLYRVASLAGLAVSLVLVSLAYQRFVFRKRPKAPEGS